MPTWAAFHELPATPSVQEPASLTIPGDQLVILATLVLGGMVLSVAVAARSLRRLNPVELLREE